MSDLKERAETAYLQNVTAQHCPSYIDGYTDAAENETANLRKELADKTAAFDEAIKLIKHKYKYDEDEISREIIAKYEGKDV